MKKITALLLVLTLTVSALAGCNPPTTDPTTEPTVNYATDPVLPEVTDPLPTDTQPQALEISISEAMADNKYVVLGHTYDYVELHNREEVPADLTSYYLTDDPANGEGLSLAGLQIPAGGYLVIVLDDSAPFRLSDQGETVCLVYGPEVISQLSFGISQGGEAFDPEGICTWPTPGYPNTEAGYLSYLESLSLPEIIISEVMSSNSGYAKEKGEYYDWVEVQNISSAPVSLQGYCLTDKRSEPARFCFPDVTLQPGECYLVYCSDAPSLGSSHAPFKLSASGETVYLIRDGVFTDALQIPGDLQQNASFGRDGKVPVYLQTPTPGSENTGGFRVSIAPPAADIPSGVYSEAVTVTLSGEGTIYYTTDGSRPTTRSKVYTKPITVKAVTTVRAFCVSEGRSSAVTAFTYAIGAEHDLPVVCVAIPQDCLTGEEGVLNHIDEDYEYEAVLTLIEDGTEKFSMPFGFRLHGNDSRKCDKQNFQLRFRSEYGAGKLNYPLFADRDISEYNSLLLKGGSEDWCYAMMRDELATALADGTSLYTQAIKPVVLYLGGEYWGIYYLRERFSDDYVASHLSVSQESVDIVYSNSARAQTGSSADFKALRSFVQSNDMTLAKNYEYLASQIDVQSLMDWYICRSYMGDKDIANIRRFRSSEADGKWRWMYFDLDWSFWHTTDEPFSGIADRSGADYALIQAVLANPQGRDAFLKRYAQLLGSVLNDASINAAVDRLESAIASEVPRDRDRWNVRVSTWENHIQRLRSYDAQGVRTQRVLEDLKAYFHLTDSEMVSYFGSLWTDSHS